MREEIDDWEKQAYLVRSFIDPSSSIRTLMMTSQTVQYDAFRIRHDIQSPLGGRSWTLAPPFGGLVHGRLRG
jgi:hypothetical protein